MPMVALTTELGYIPQIYAKGFEENVLTLFCQYINS